MGHHVCKRFAAATLLAVAAVVCGAARPTAAAAAAAAAGGATRPKIAVPVVDGVDQSPSAPEDYGKCTSHIDQRIAPTSNWCKFGRLGYCESAPAAPPPPPLRRSTYPKRRGGGRYAKPC
jgi:hypothetical protein